MKKYWAHGIAIVSTILTLFALSCSMDLEPAKSGTTSVSFTIGTLIPPANALENLQPVPGRAVAPDYGYLYIRTLGGPTGSKGPFYGPFRLSAGQTFTTTDIPAGTYDGIGILYATEPLESLTGYWNDQEMTFTELMRLPDDQFASFSDGVPGHEGPSAMEMLVDGFASGEMIRDRRIRANQNNTLRVTLVPVCGTSFDLDTMTSTTPAGEMVPDNLVVRKFYRIENVHELPAARITGLECTLEPVDNPSVTVGRIFVFSEDGTLLESHNPAERITEARTYTLPQGQDSTLFLYLEFRESYPSITVTANLAPVSPYTKLLFVRSNGTGDGTSPEAPMNMTDLIDKLSEGPHPTTAVLIADDITTNVNLSFTSGNTFQLTSLTAQPRTLYFNNSILFSHGTLRIQNIRLDGAGTPSLEGPLIETSSDLHLDTGAVLTNRINYGALVGGIQITGTGNLYINDGAIIESCRGYYGGGVMIRDSGTFTMNGGIIRNCSAEILGGAVCIEPTIIAASPRFNMNGGVIDSCTAQSGGAVGLIPGMDSAVVTFVLDGGVIQNGNASVRGGAVCSIVSNQSAVSQVQIIRGVIQNCTAPLGGAIYSINSTYSESNLSVTGGTIRNCNATGSLSNPDGMGGAIFARTNDTATYQFLMSGGEIRECRAYGTGPDGFGMGGAVYLFCNDMGPATSTMSGGTIRDCEARDSSSASSQGAGGAFYIVGYGAYLQLQSSARIENCLATQGWGLWYDTPDNIDPQPETETASFESFFFGASTNKGYREM